MIRHLRHLIMWLRLPSSHSKKRMWHLWMLMTGSSRGICHQTAWDPRQSTALLLPVLSTEKSLCVISSSPELYMGCEICQMVADNFEIRFSSHRKENHVPTDRLSEIGYHSSVDILYLIKLHLKYYARQLAWIDNFFANTMRKQQRTQWWYHMVYIIYRTYRYIVQLPVMVNGKPYL